MAVENVYEPKTKNPTNPKVVGEKTEEGKGTIYWEDKAKEARAKREYEEEEEKAQRAKERQENPPEPPFKVQGSVNLGTIDFQKQQEELKNTIQQIQDNAKQDMAALDQRSEHYREELHKIQLAMVENTMKAQIDSLQRTIAEGLARPKDPGIMEQIDQMRQIASALGYNKPDANAGLPAEVQLKMLEIEINDKQTQRKFEWDKMMSERTWQLELKKLESDNAAKMAEITAEKEKRGIWVSPLEAIGAAIARGLMDSGGEIPHVESKTKRKRSTHRLQAGEGESGTVECPECGEPIAIAPSARSAVCPSCDATISIERQKGG